MVENRVSFAFTGQQVPLWQQMISHAFTIVCFHILCREAKTEILCCHKQYRKRKSSKAIHAEKHVKHNFTSSLGTTNYSSDYRDYQIPCSN